MLRFSLHLSPWKRYSKLEVVAHAYHRCNLSTREPEAGGCEFEASLGYICYAQTHGVPAKANKGD